MTIKAVFWDFGGVLTSSPFEAFERFERDNGLPRRFLRTVNPTMVEALRRCQRRFRTACLTNNIPLGTGPDTRRARERAAVFEQVSGLFDLVLESSKLGVRKPDPRLYRIACEQLSVEPTQVAYLDDLGVNLKPARAMGMATIKVTEPAQALRELEAVLGLPLSEHQESSGEFNP